MAQGDYFLHSRNLPFTFMSSGASACPSPGNPWSVLALWSVFFRTSSKWNPRIHSVLCLVPFIQHCGYFGPIHVGGCFSGPFISLSKFYRVTVPQFLYPFTTVVLQGQQPKIFQAPFCEKLGPFSVKLSWDLLLKANWPCVCGLFLDSLLILWSVSPYGPTNTNQPVLMNSQLFEISGASPWGSAPLSQHHCDFLRSFPFPCKSLNQLVQWPKESPSVPWPFL